jgi:hypothetical protein
MYDVKQLIAAVRARNGIRVEPDDPIFALVTINELVLEQAARRVSDEITTRLVAFNAGMDKTERRAGSLLAQDVKEAGTQIGENVARTGRVVECHRRAGAQASPAPGRWKHRALKRAFAAGSRVTQPVPNIWRNRDACIGTNATRPD